MSYETDGTEDIMIEFNKSGLPLIIAFSGIGQGLMMPIFEFKNFLKKNYDCNMIFIKDPNKLWYFRGVRNTNKSIEGIQYFLNNYISKIKPSKIVTIGCSMGGFASILIGKLINADHTLAFSPQTFIRKSIMAKYKDNRFSKYLLHLYKIIPDHELYDLSELSYNNNHNIIIVCGNQSNIDKVHSERMNRFENVNIKYFPGNHRIVKHLRDNGVLKNMCDEILK